MEQTHNATFQLGQLAAGLLADDDQSRLSTLARLEAERTLPSLPEDVVRGLLACLGHTTKKIQRGAATVLIRFAPRQPGIIEALTHRLTDPDPRLRWTAAFTLSQLDLPSPSPQRVNVLSNQTQLLDTSLVTCKRHTILNLYKEDTCMTTIFDLKEVIKVLH